MVYFSIILLFLSIFTLILGIMNVINKDKIFMEHRIKQIDSINDIYENYTENKSFAERTLVPFYNLLIILILRTMPSYKLGSIKKKLDKAGMLKSTSPEKWIYMRILTITISTTIVGLLVYLLSLNFSKVLLICTIFMIFIYVFFNFYLSSRIDNRKKIILKDLPYTLDLITVSVEAGLSFDGAIARVIENIDGELCDEFNKTLKEIRMGVERKEALKSLSERCDVKELSMLITSLIQADELGVSLGKVLRIESCQLREHRKQAAREKAMKAPIKMLFPLIFFIFPSIFIIILGPAIIKIFNIFLK